MKKKIPSLRQNKKLRKDSKPIVDMNSEIETKKAELKNR